MYVRYQTVRNAVAGVVTAGVVAIVAYSRFRTSDVPQQLLTQPAPALVHYVEDDRLPNPVNLPELANDAEVVEEDFAAQTTLPSAQRSSSMPTPSAHTDRVAASTDEDARYVTAMKQALARANASGQGKDVLGASSPWKLNLYDDDHDGQWDRAKLDRNRDEIDDEKWNRKNGVWEKDGGARVWRGDHWVSADTQLGQPSPDKATTLQPTGEAAADLTRYQAAMRIALARADASGKGKDVLGASSPWKLNLYDDDRDGQWDRAKLDYNRDEVDDEKWTFKQGRWEKDGGATIWDGTQWQGAKSR